MVSTLVTALVSALLFVGGAGTMVAMDENTTVSFDLIEESIIGRTLEKVGFGEDESKPNRNHQERHLSKMTNDVMLIKACLINETCVTLADSNDVELFTQLEETEQKISELEICIEDESCKPIKRGKKHVSSANTYNFTERAQKILTKSEMRLAMIAACRESVDCTIDDEILVKMEEHAQNYTEKAEACLIDETSCDELKHKKGKRGHHRGKKNHR